MRSNKAWRKWITAAKRRIPPPVTAMTFVSAWRTMLRPALMHCSDNCYYVVKGGQARRALMNEYMVGKLGAAMDAAVPVVRTVLVTDELISAEPQLQHMESGLAYGSAFIQNVTEKPGVNYGNHPENRPRFAGLCLLFGIVCARDIQFIYTKQKPNLVYSIDHAEFFPGWVRDWHHECLVAAEPPEPHRPLRIAVGLTHRELEMAFRQLARITDDAIAEAVAGCATEWRVTDEDRVQRAEFIASRRDRLLEMRAA